MSRCCVPAGCGNLCWLWPSPAGCLSLPPPGHSHRTLLQVQVQQRRWWPIANLKNTIWVGTGSRFKDGPIYFCPFSPLLHFFSPIPPALKAFFFFGLNLHQPKPLGDPLLCMREAWQKSDPTCLSQGREVQGSKVSGHETRWGTTVSKCMRSCQTGDMEDDCTTSAAPPPPPSPLLRCGLICCCTLVGNCKWRRGKKINIKKRFFFLYYSCMDHVMQEPP